MSSVKRTALVPYSPSDMYSLVSDIESYPRFLSWCGGARVIEKSDEEIEASIDIAYMGLHKSFTTRNRLQENKLMEMRLIEGPFKYLNGCWRFQGLGDEGCKVSLDLEYEYSNRLVGMTLGPVFERIVNDLIDNFIQRAAELYDGKR